MYMGDTQGEITKEGGLELWLKWHLPQRKINLCRNDQMKESSFRLLRVEIKAN